MQNLPLLKLDKEHEEPQQTIDEEDDDVAFHNVSEVEPTDDEPASEPTTTPSGEQVVEQLQKSMAKASDLVAKTAAAVDASAKETTNLRETVGTTTKALQALVDAKNKTENASPAMSAEAAALATTSFALASFGPPASAAAQRRASRSRMFASRRRR